MKENQVELEKLNIKKENLFLTKTEKGCVIKLSFFYKDCGDNDTLVEVSDSVFDELVDNKRSDKREEMWDYRHRVPFTFDENETAALEGVFEPGADERFFHQVSLCELKIAMKNLDAEKRRRCELYFYEGYSCKRIAKMDGVNVNSVRKSIARTLSRLRTMLLESD